MEQLQGDKDLLWSLVEQLKEDVGQLKDLDLERSKGWRESSQT